MSSFASSASNVCSSQSGTIRDLATHSVGQPASLLDQPFVVGPGFSAVPAKLVAHIVNDKYVDLSELLAVNLLQKESEPQLLFDGRLVLMHQPKKQHRKIEDIASWMEAFSIFALILVHPLPAPMEGFTAIPATHPTHVSSFLGKSLARVRSSVPRACGRHSLDGLVVYEHPAV